MAFTTPTNTFKKPPSYLWFCHSCPRSTTSMVSSSSSYSPSSCRSVWSSSDSNKPLYRWQSQNPLSKKDRFCNISMVFSRYNSWSNISTMSFDESRRYVNSMNNQSCADFRLHVESRRGNSYAQMVPWGNKDGNTYITPVLDAHPRNPFREKDFRPQTWNQATQALRKRKEEVRKVGHAVPNVQYAGSVITEPREHEARDMTGYEKFPSQPPNGNLQQGVSRKMQISSPAHNGNTQKHGHDVMHNSKSLELKQEVSENTPVNGVHRMDSQSEKRSAGRTDKSSAAANADALKETYIVPLDSKNSTHLRKRLMSIYEKVLVVDNISLAKEVVRKLTTQYRHLVHACDTEVAAIDVKQETPVDHGEVICFSIYSGHEADFGNGKSCIWVDVLDGGGKSMLDIFSAFFENPSIKKVWHNYSFDNHVIENYDLKLSGFHADTMHMARLWDSSRRMSGGYSLEALTSDSKGIMSGADLGPNEELIGKVSMKNIFGRKKLKKDGSEGKVVVIPPVEVLQRVERVPWVCYSALDSISTLKLYERLKSKLSNREWKFNGVTKGTLFDFYEQYWRPFGELLVKMETEGMLVDRDYLMEIEEVAKAEQQIAADRFRNWASKQCADAKFMNVGSDTQLRQLFFGGILNSKDPSQCLPMEKEFKVPNVDNIIEEGKKTATKFRKIKLKTICSGLQPETYTASGWPSVCGDVLKSLAGKVSMDYDFVDEETAEVDENADDPTDIELSETKSVPFVNNSETAYGTAYAAFGGGSEGHEACHAIAALCEVCSIDSLISNFILPLQGSHISGRNGRIHCSLNINTETGRLSARRPNLQNQPALEKDRYKIRQAFIAAPGNSLIVADYGQLELRILAHLADCKSMLDAFKAGGDFHSRTAMNMYPYIRDAVESKEVLLEWHPQPGEESPPVPLLKDMFASERRKAKMLNFSIAYGKTAVGLSRDWKVSVTEARETVARWYGGREEVLRWQEARKREARKIGCVYTLLGRARTFPSTKDASPSHRGHIERAAINTPVQGSAADVAMCAMLEISKNARLRELGWKLLLQVHDEVILEGPSESADVAKAIVVECMSKPFDGKNILKVGLSVDAKFAKNWYSAK
ncbi:DNA polymerase I B, chloroplastic/mitochondrial isoform X2 [Cynara cardunculus var. scolymus]|uniref:DNA polymerase I B, chloroplastic/mitochondrial isoform X2 n=1 Tax=Cynara cardunculus var. scolymus TaxID=59895 RepID=UPI000D62C80B|nr:DNA polymerase I B, chloroplastic/mitochondrial isoform X2 [Cynara cardunculus var. scolymus]